MTILTLLIIAIDSRDRNLGYRTSSLTMLSNTSSSSSPGNGDSPTSISNIKTPRPHQSTARVYDVSVKTEIFKLYNGLISLYPNTFKLRTFGMRFQFKEPFITFWRKELRRSAEGSCSITIAHAFFT